MYGHLEIMMCGTSDYVALNEMILNGPYRIEKIHKINSQNEPLLCRLTSQCGAYLSHQDNKYITRNLHEN